MSVGDPLASCVACGETGESSRGTQCKPCKGTGLIGWISPSQLKQFEGCELSWWLHYVGKAPKGETTPAQAKGLRIHYELEHAVKAGRAITDPVATRMYDRIRLDGATVTEHTVVGMIQGVGFYAIADLITGATLFDYKTGNPRYALTPRTLPHDTQAIVLANLVPHVDTLKWLYGSTKSDAAFTVEIPAGAARQNTSAVVTRAEALLATRNGHRLPIANKDNCYAYNSQCPHYAYCPAHDNEVTNPFATENTMAIDPDRLAAAKARIAAMQGASAPVAETPAAQPKTESALEKAKREMAEKVAELEAQAEAEAEAQAEEEAQAEAQAAAQAQAAATQKPAYANAPTARGRIQEAKSKEGIEAMGTKSIGVLYINCAPDDGVYVTADTIIGEANARVCAAHKVPHYAALEYGQGLPALELAIAEVLAELEPAAIVAYRVPALPAFVRAASAIVRGLA